MINTLAMRNFKAFSDQQLPFRPLTVLSGLNGMGKSTCLQSLLLVRQSYLEGALERGQLVLNGDLVQLGSGQDVLFDGATTDEIALGIEFSGAAALLWRFAYNRADDTLDAAEISTTPLDPFTLFNDNFQYLQAERLGPRASFEMSERTVRRHRQLGTQGEFTAHFLSLFQDEPVLAAIRHEAARERSKLYQQVEAWMHEISPGLRFKFEAYSAIDRVQVGVSYVRDDGETNPYRPTNVGFGIIYVLPLLVAVLSAKPGALLIFENPEAHLHPRGQTQLALLFAKAAAAGIQIIVETHSDHILNGVRWAVKQRRLTPDEVQMLYFHRPDQDKRQTAVQVVTPALDNDGRFVDELPPGFFDEFERVLMDLL